MLKLSDRDLKAIARSRTNQKTLKAFILVFAVMLLWLVAETLQLTGTIEVCQMCVTYTGAVASMVTLFIVLLADYIQYRKEVKSVKKEYENDDTI
jgi:hypothetical protein